VSLETVGKTASLSRANKCYKNVGNFQYLWITITNGNCESRVFLPPLIIRSVNYKTISITYVVNLKSYTI
jgi:hypothetical protein